MDESYFTSQLTNKHPFLPILNYYTQGEFILAKV
jgi:hypothetical protein